MTKRIYPSDLSDGEYKYLKKCLPKQSGFGRPPEHTRREILNGIFYVLRSGCAWRYLPKDYPPWQSVYHYFRLWRKSGWWKQTNKRLRRLLRRRSGRAVQSSVAIIDSQSAKTVDTAREAVSFDGGKKIKGRKRHLLVDSLGLVITVVVHAAGISETAGAREVLSELISRWWRLKLIWLDGGYKNSLKAWLKGLQRWREVRLEWVLRLEGEKGFKLLPKRWIVERTFGWLNKQRRLSKDYEGKDGINDYIAQRRQDAVNPERRGTKAAAHYVLELKGGEEKEIHLRLSDKELKRPFGKDFEKSFTNRKREADEFYAEIIPNNLSTDAQNVMRQAFAGMLWSKQFYHYVVKDWLAGDANQPKPPDERKSGRNAEWSHLYNADVISMPDKWEYPWYAAWDLAFHCIALAPVDSEFAKEQLLLMLREWYMHPNGLIPLFAVGTIEPEILDKLPNFKKRLYWFIENRADLTGNVSCMRTPGMGERRLLAVAFRERLEKILKVMLDENEFLSPYGIRALSRIYKDNPYILNVSGDEHRVDYEPAESSSGLFGGNSNWRGPVWMPVNYLLIESLQKFHHYYGDDLRVECPTGSGNMMNLQEVAAEISRRLSHIFLKNGDGKRAVFGDEHKLQTNAHFRDYVSFYEYFHGDTGAGIGASHQTGWTGLIAKLLQQNGE